MVVVSIDGVDGTGKSTLIKLLSENLVDLDIVRVETSNRKDMMPEIRSFLNENLKDHVVARFVYFSLADLFASNEAKEYAKSGKNVILDRFVYSTEAHHRAFDIYFSGMNLATLDTLSRESREVPDKSRYGNLPIC